MITHKLVILSSNEIKSKFYRFQFSGPSACNKIMEQNTIKRQQVELKMTRTINITVTKWKLQKDQVFRKYLMLLELP